jgi:myo-inositol-1(or 4)-monophosphatase
MSSPSHLLSALGDLTRRAGALAQEARKKGGSELKPDGSIVTIADREVETFLRGELPQLVPGSTIWGEEFGREAEGKNGLWVVDPVDGTSNFSFGNPLWGVTVALVQGNEIKVGAVALPDLGEIYLGELGCGAWKDGAPLPRIAPGPVMDHELVSFDDGLLARFPQANIPGKMRYAGAFVVDGMFVAAQRLRGMIGRREQLYDIASCVLINSELGADVRYADGKPFHIGELSTGKKINKPWLMFPKDSGFRLP